MAGVDIGATHLGLILTDYAAQILKIKDIPFDVSKGPEICLAEINSHFNDSLAESDLTIADMKAIGVGVPGPVVTEKGDVIAPPIMPGWDHFPIQHHLEDQWKCLVSLNNDAELGALGEWAYGAGRGECPLLYVKVGYGIGAGLLINGQITIHENGLLCTCDNRNFLEALAGGRSIVIHAQEV